MTVANDFGGVAHACAGVKLQIPASGVTKKITQTTGARGQGRAFCWCFRSPLYKLKTSRYIQQAYGHLLAQGFHSVVAQGFPSLVCAWTGLVRGPSYFDDTEKCKTEKKTSRVSCRCFQLLVGALPQCLVEDNPGSIQHAYGHLLTRRGLRWRVSPYQKYHFNKLITLSLRIRRRCRQRK